ncbi:cupin domain-containing protein [Pedobacter psychrodurus]|uniref:Cupin domain-containing protein n=1 Tax=Pedobacter psychrodurus TaxID=2530456 RepID=A0A4R0Q582_9SPHI|nr:cupin domain-containing protein [Pedobacter psychrodurus]TCD26462.1 cupin domain-containing protein [Pedobacter psychrodurus]
MKTNFSILAIAVVLSLSAFFLPGTAAAQQGITRIPLQRHDLSIHGWETVQVRIDFDKGTAFGMHTHPGEEVIYVLKGTFIYEVEGKEKVTLKAGDTLFIPAGVAHAAKNIGKTKAIELATYIVEKGKPLLVKK